MLKDMSQMKSFGVQYSLFFTFSLTLTSKIESLPQDDKNEEDDKPLRKRHSNWVR